VVQEGELTAGIRGARATFFVVVVFVVVVGATTTESEKHKTNGYV
jgi:hypothetical protein